MKFLKLFGVLAYIGAFLSATPLAHAQDYPNHVIKIVVPFPAGGPSDVFARLIAQAMSNRLPQTVLVENVVGGGGVVGAQSVAQSDADGYTLLQFDITQVLLPNLRTDMPFDWKTAFTPVQGLHQAPLVLVASSGLGAKSVADLVERVKAENYNYGSGGNGSLSHIAGARFAQQTEIGATHIPYKGLADALTAVRSGGEVKFAFVSPSDAISFVKAGLLTALATTGTDRLAILPDVPTLKEQGIDFTAAVWTNSFVVPAGTPDDIVTALRDVISEAIQDPIVQDNSTALGFELTEMDGSALTKFYTEQQALWGEVTKSNNITLGQ
ncbi:Bug family tripartite tricarboxylate transporter substrate binding protein [Devosia sp. A369]